GRAIVASLLERLTELGATPVEADTDGVYFVPPPGHRPEDDDALLERIAVGLPAGIQLELDGRYAAMFSYKMKTYALLDAGARQVAAAYELAATAGRVLEPGDQISYYVTGRSAGVAVNEHAKLASQWDRARPDENVEYYQAKVREIWERFRPFAEFDGLRPYVEDPESQLSLF